MSAWWNTYVTSLFVLIAIAVIAAVAMVASGRWGQLPEASMDLRPETPDGRPTFDVVLRGYRMDEVDAELERLQRRIDELSAGRDARGNQVDSPPGP